MLFVKDGRLVLSKSQDLTQKQLFRLKSLSNDKSRQEYMLSLMGLKPAELNFEFTKKYGKDVLQGKTKNSILSTFQRMLRKDTSHKPFSQSTKWVGVEIECLIPVRESDRNGNAHYRAKQDLAALFTENNITLVQVKDDGSISGGQENEDDGDEQDGSRSYTGVEIAILFDSARGFQKLEKVCGLLRQVGAIVNKSCGLHVHLDARHLEARQCKTLGQNITNALPVLRYMMPRSRQENDYCHLSMSTFNGRRYHAVNLTAFRKFQTCEIRLHSGTINYEKIKNWIELLQLIGSTRIRSPIETVQDLIDVTEMPDRLVEYLEKRVKQFWSNRNEVMNKLFPSDSEVA